jgi:hypothetical protein
VAAETGIGPPPPRLPLWPPLDCPVAPLCDCRWDNSMPPPVNNKAAAIQSERREICRNRLIAI